MEILRWDRLRMWLFWKLFPVQYRALWWYSDRHQWLSIHREGGSVIMHDEGETAREAMSFDELHR